MEDLTSLSLIEVRNRLRDGSVTAEAVTKACLDRIHDTEPLIHALITVREDALSEAHTMDRDGIDPGKPLWGVPIAVKDALATKGTRTTAASRILKNFIPFYDAYAVERLRKAGAVIIGKANMDEFAMGSTTENSAYGATANPRDVKRVPGGSSGGSAATVAANQCYAALGTDTGGSIRQPASLCGCVGLKPTYGAVSRYGLLAYGSSLDQIGPLARKVADTALVYSVIAGHDGRDGTSSPKPDQPADLADRVASVKDLRGATIGLPMEFMQTDGLDPAVTKVMADAQILAKDLGATIIPVSLPHATRHAIAAYYIIAMAEASSNLSRYDGVRYGHRTAGPKDLDDLYTASRTEGFGEEVQRRILLGTYVLSAGYYDAYYRKAAQVRTLIRNDYAKALERCDMMLAPVSPIPAWDRGGFAGNPLQMYLMDIFTVSLNLAGFPGLSLPMGKADGLPVGMQLIGREFGETDILSAGNAMEKALGNLAFANV